MVWYIVGLYGMVHGWFTWYGTSLVYMMWYIVGLYGMVHRWSIWYDTLLVSEQGITITIFMVIVFFMIICTT